MFKNLKSPKTIIFILFILLLLNEKEFFKNFYDISFRPYHHRMVREHGLCSMNGYGFVKKIMSADKNSSGLGILAWSIAKKLIDDDGKTILNNDSNTHILTNFKNLENIRVLNFENFSPIDSLFYNNKKKFSEKYFFLINFIEKNNDHINRLKNFIHIDPLNPSFNVNIESYNVIYQEQGCLLIEKIN